MAARSIDERLADIEAKENRLKQQKKKLKAEQSKQARNARTRRLIENGALAEKYLNCEKIEPTKFENLLKQLVHIEQVKALISAPKSSDVNESAAN